jgi:hypothetical protein
MAKKYGVRFTHPPNVCPLANAASRKAATEGWKQMPSLLQKHGVKMLSLDHFDPEHFLVGMFEAESPEALRDFLMEAGLMAWNDLKINSITPAKDLMDNIDQAPPTIF